MEEGIYFYLLSNNTMINNTSIQKVPGSNLCNRSVKYKKITFVTLSCPKKCCNITLKQIKTASFHIPTSSLLYKPTP